MNEEKNKKVLLIIGLVSFAFAVIIVGSIGLRMDRRANMMGLGENDYRYNQARMMGRSSVPYPMPPIDDKNQFIIPQDAAKSGELAIVVDDLEASRKKVAEIAAQNNGTVYATYISYTSSDIKNGSMVVQVPIESFDAAFESLKIAGRQVVQESTRQIEKRIIYPMMQSTGTDARETISTSDIKKNDEEITEETNANSVSSSASPEIAIYPRPAQFQEQNKGYIRIVFADFALGKRGSTIDNSSKNIFYSSSSEDVQKIMWIGFGIKILLLIALISLLIFIFKKIILSLRKHRISNEKLRTRLTERKSVVHIVRQSPRSRKVIISKK